MYENTLSHISYQSPLFMQLRDSKMCLKQKVFIIFEIVPTIIASKCLIMGDAYLL